jgi:hypothetical protein
MPSSRFLRRLLLAPVLATAAVALAAAPSHAADDPAAPFLQPMPRPFSASSPWNVQLPAAAPLSANSQQLSDTLRSDVATYGQWINSYSSSAPVYTVPADQPLVTVIPDKSNPQLVAAFQQVPLPATARPASGTDGQLVLIQPSTGKMWEFWKLRKDSAGNWRAAWGGWSDDYRTDDGVFENSNFGAAGSGLALLGGMPRLAEMDTGVIDHALALVVPKTTKSLLTAPAVRTDGTVDGPDTIPMGTRFRIDPDVDLSKVSMTAAARMFAMAAQKYGMIVRDTTASTVAFEMEDPTPAGINQNTRYFGGKSASQTLYSFPWWAVEAIDAPTTAWTGPIPYPVPPVASPTPTPTPTPAP